MDPPDGGGAAAPPPYGPAPLAALPKLRQPPAPLMMPELEAVAAALPGKKRRLRESFERLAATSPDPLPFRWEDLDAYLSSFQFPVTLRSRQPQVPLATPVPADDPITTTEEDGLVVVNKGKKRKASSLAAEATEGAHAMGIKEARRPLEKMAGNGTGLSCPAPLGCGNDDTAKEAHVSTSPLDPVSKIAVVQPEQSRRPSTAASLVQQAGASNTASRQPRPPRWDVPAVVVAAPAFAAGDVDNAKKLLAVERNVKKMAAGSVSHKAEEAKVGKALARIEADTQVGSPVCKISAVQHEAATNIMPALALADSCNVSLSLTLKPESCVEAGDVDKNVVVVADEKISKAIMEADTRATPAAQVEAQEAYEVSPPFPLISGNGFAETGVDVGTVVLAEPGRNTCVQQNSAAIVPKLLPDDSPETAEPLQAKGPDASHVLRQQHMSEGRSHPVSQAGNPPLRNHGGRPTVGINFLRKAQEAFQRCTKDKEARLGKGSAGQDNRPAAARGSSALPPIDCRNGKGKPNSVIVEPSEGSTNSNKFCYKCGSKGHVTHKCRTEKHLVELYAKHKKEKKANKICFRCGTKGHFANKCRTPKHLVDLYQNHLTR